LQKPIPFWELESIYGPIGEKIHGSVVALDRIRGRKLFEKAIKR
jgi:hypothetical protein